MPFVQIADNAGKILSITPQRVEISFNQQTDKNLDVSQSTQYAMERLEAIWESLTNLGIEFNRFATVVNRITKGSMKPGELVRKFCKPAAASGPFKRTENFEIHSHKTFDAGFGALNSWVRLRTAKQGVSGNEKDVVLVEQDMNTPPNSKANDIISMQRFFSGIGPAIENCFKIYFPG